MTSTASELDHQLERATEAEVDADVEAMVARAVTAQETFENWTDLRVDALLRELANAFADQAEELAMATVAETGLGNVEDKTIKNRFASLTVFESIAGKITQGQIAVDARRQVSELASPVGVIFAIVPHDRPGRDRHLQDADRAQDAQRPDPERPPPGVRTPAAWPPRSRTAC